MEVGAGGRRGWAVCQYGNFIIGGNIVTLAVGDLK